MVVDSKGVAESGSSSIAVSCFGSLPEKWSENTGTHINGWYGPSKQHPWTTIDSERHKDVDRVISILLSGAFSAATLG